MTNTRDVISFPHLTIDKSAYSVIADGKKVSLTLKEFQLLYFFASTPGKAFNREQLIKEVWHYEYFEDMRTVDTHIKRLRAKLSNKSKVAAEMISTVRGFGYRFDVINGTSKNAI